MKFLSILIAIFCFSAGAFYIPSDHNHEILFSASAPAEAVKNRQFLQEQNISFGAHFIKT